MSALTIAIPSKGRLKEQSEAYFAESGYRIEQDGGERGYRAKFAGKNDISILLLPAREIAQGLIDGAFHAGITGEDLLHELSEVPGKNAIVIRRLGFGGADVVVAVPNCWLDVSTLTDLDAAGALFRQTHGRRLRVATKYLRITRRYFANAAFGEYRLVYSAGATEAAPASGTADLIVDITSTGATLLANNLKILDDGVMLKSEASFTIARKADWSEAALRALGDLRTGLSLTGEEASALDGFMKKL